MRITYSQRLLVALLNIDTDKNSDDILHMTNARRI